MPLPIRASLAKLSPLKHLSSRPHRLLSTLPFKPPPRLRHRFASTASDASQSASSTLLPSQRTPSVSQNDNINKIVEDISRLTLLQAADLVTMLKQRLNIQELSMPIANTVAAAVPAQEEEVPPAEAEKPKVKTIFNVKIESIDPAAKPKIIREVKAQVPNLNLMEAKKFVESLPKVVKENVPKADAEKLMATFVALGAKVTLE